MQARKLETFKVALNQNEYPVGRSVHYISPDQKFSVKCRVLHYENGVALVVPVEAKKPM